MTSPNVAGRVYCGYSSRPAANDSSDVGRLVDGARQQPQDRVEDHQRRQLPAGQHVVADRQLQVDHRPHPLVDALVARAQEHEVRPLGELVGRRLAEHLPRGIEQDHGRVRPLDVGQRGGHDVRRGGPCPLPRRTCSRRRSGGGPSPHRRRSWTRTRARPRSWIRAGMLSPSGSLDHRREQGEDVDLERHQAPGAGAPPSLDPAGRRLAHRAGPLRRLGRALGSLRLLARPAVAGPDVRRRRPGARRGRARRGRRSSRRAPARSSATISLMPGMSSSPRGPRTRNTSAPPAR